MLESLTLKPAGAVELKNYSEADLIKLRDDIDNLLGVDMRTLNLNAELSLQYLQAKRLYAEVANDKDTPANQKAQVLNTISSVLGAITKMSVEIHSMERQKKIEAATLAAVKDLPMEAKERFFSLLKDFLEAPSG